MSIDWSQFDRSSFYDELIDGTRTPRAHAAKLLEFLAGLEPGELATRQEAAELLMRLIGRLRKHCLLHRCG